LLFEFVLECANRKVQENREGLQMNGKHELPIYANDVNKLGANINNIKKALLEVIREGGLEVNTDKTMYKVTSRHQNAK
jgi:hypothetical protein